MRKPRFSLKTLVFVVTLAAVLLGWWVDHCELATENRELDRRFQEAYTRQKEYHTVYSASVQIRRQLRSDLQDAKLELWRIRRADLLEKAEESATR
jgi:hypothetical protein